MCVLSIKVAIRKKSGNLSYAPRITYFKLKMHNPQPSGLMRPLWLIHVALFTTIKIFSSFIDVESKEVLLLFQIN